MLGKIEKNIVEKDGEFLKALGVGANKSRIWAYQKWFADALLKPAKLANY